MRLRPPVTLTLALLTAIVLNACTGVPAGVPTATPKPTASPSGDPSLERLMSALTYFPTVDEVITIQVDSIQVSLESMDEAGVLDIAEAVTEAVASDPHIGLSSVTVHAPYQGDLTLSYPLSATAEELASEIHYWFALDQLFSGHFYLSLGASGAEPSGTPPTLYLRQIQASPFNVSADEWAAIRAVPDTSAAQKQWWLDGTTVRDQPPSYEVIELSQALKALAPQDADWSAGLEVYDPEPEVIHVTVVGKDLGAQNLQAWPNWQHVLEAAQRVLGAGLPPASFRLYANDTGVEQGYVHFGPCELQGTAAAVDDVLWQALSSSAIPLPAGSGPGGCVNA